LDKSEFPSIASRKDTKLEETRDKERDKDVTIN